MAAYADYWRHFSQATVGDLRRLASPGMRFVDPFNDVSGIERVLAVLGDAFQHGDDVRIEVSHHAAAGDTAYFRWHYSFRPKGGRSAGRWRFEGVSEVRFDGRGRVVSHVDHWEAASQFYARLPVLGWLIRLVRGRLAVAA